MPTNAADIAHYKFPKIGFTMQALLNAIAQMHNTTDAHRVFHGRGGMYPDCEHWTLDWFAPV